MKIGLIGSSGGHLTHLYMLKPTWEIHDRFWVTFDKEDARSILREEKMYPCYFPTNRNIKNLIKNTFLAWKVLKKERPDILISSGAAVAVPFFYLGKLFGTKLIYIEVFDRVDKATLTGKLVYPIVDEFKGNGSIKDDVYMQIGYSTYEPKYCQWKKLISYDEMNQMYDKADIIITHGGPASFMKALELNKIPIVVPRQLEFEEHINNHQVDFVKFVETRLNNIIGVYDVKQLAFIYTSYADLVSKKKNNLCDNNRLFNKKLKRLLENM